MKEEKKTNRTCNWTPGYEPGSGNTWTGQGPGCRTQIEEIRPQLSPISKKIFDRKVKIKEE
jgi:hypothetical protein